ncbi:iron-hydroxamate ABC transporter substrate-binding protein [Cohnella endophytica]|uniref:Iron-hydroxamate ABC transporter substrate-binding protein n=1 Tax=Cohnella endophytica TaxID=2419778 RepID=A0A494XIR0_9BACL|nr:iron-hydroxamate ABC transporter substrate-binding protein [Cohnella endophytica]RKP47974.1 iron-hydroxamate ABC transporter substrate-binding protein [Cohnella endophytica]
MNKRLIPLTVLIALVLVLSACGNKANNNSAPASNDASASGSASPSSSPSASGSAENGDAPTFIYQSQTGPVEVPTNPQRVIVLSSYAGDVLSLNVNLVGVDSWSKMNPNFEAKLKDVAEVSDENLEKIIELKPDLIIGLDNVKNLEKLKQIAPTVVFTYGKLDYLTQHLEVGKALNKQKEAQAWIDDFKSRAETIGAEIKAKIGEGKTVSVIESFDKQLYVFGDNWGRGTEILYQQMQLPMPAKVSEMTKKDGYYAISPEVISEYMGDYVIFSKNPDADNSFQQTDTYKNTTAAKNGHVIEVNAKAFYFNDALTLDYQLETFKQQFLGN